MVVTKQEHYTDTAQQVILYAKQADTDKIAYPLLQGAFNPGFAIPQYDEVVADSMTKPTSVEFKLSGVNVATLTITYTGAGVSIVRT